MCEASVRPCADLVDDVFLLKGIDLAFHDGQDVLRVIRRELKLGMLWSFRVISSCR